MCTKRRRLTHCEWWFMCPSVWFHSLHKGDELFRAQYERAGDFYANGHKMVSCHFVPCVDVAQYPFPTLRSTSPIWSRDALPSFYALQFHENPTEPFLKWHLDFARARVPFSLAHSRRCTGKPLHHYRHKPTTTAQPARGIERHRTEPTVLGGRDRMCKKKGKHRPWESCRASQWDRK